MTVGLARTTSPTAPPVAAPARQASRTLSRFDPRRLATLLHRYVGLALAGFLILSGLTGSVLVFQREIDAWLNPQLWAVTAEGPALSASEIAARVEAHDPRVRARWIPLEPDEGLDVWVDPKIDPATGAPYAIGYNQMFVDPVTGEINGTRRYGPPTLNREELIPFIDLFHRTLSIPGLWGTWLMGGIALIWLFDCFVGAYLTLPRGAKGPRAFLSKWKTAWTLKPRASSTRRNLDLHRAGGLWLWGVLATLAASGVALNLEHEIFEPVVGVFSPISENEFEHQPMDFANPIPPAFGFDEAIVRARDLAAIPADQRVSGIYYAAEIGGYGVAFGEPYEAGLGITWAYVGNDGSLIELTRPGVGTAGDIVAQAQLPLHSGQILGLPTRILICIAGLATAGLSITGVIIWARKRAARRR
ncbi:PepSY-associated TM helix domain-containing protein [Brevundimonas lutea]|uniref:PepSY-associated TM helix domain-containing protein n=1 Tax=Brevundimonas lutea TaxID=2293980 RepID=UPI000F030E64|nr:PepSY-associated TM helix domain-containing protein [Brevundimonas lutea]